MVAPPSTGDDAPVSCPKCGATAQGGSCPKCGLVIAKFNASVLEEGVPEELRSLWRSTEERWGETAAHALFVETCLSRGASGYAAACYRRRLPDPAAKAQLQRIESRLLEMLAMTAAEPRQRTTGRGQLIAALILALVAATVALLVISAMRR